MIFKTKYSQLYENRKAHNVISTINITPFVDVMLVLLVVFMISAPLLVKGININLPKNSSAPPIEDNRPFTLSINDEGRIYYDDKEVLFVNLKNFVTLNLLSHTARIYIRGDKKINYGHVMKIISELNSAGYKKISLVTESENK